MPITPDVGHTVRHLLARLRADQRGISLIEVMTAASLLAVVLGAILSLSETTAKIAPNDDERAHVIDESRSALRGMTGEIRTAKTVVSSSAYALHVKVGATDVTWNCDVAHPSIAGRSRCTRKTGTGSAVVVVDHLINKDKGVPVFTRDGSYVSVHLQLAAAGDRVDGHKHAINLDDGAFVRNAPVTP